MTRIKAQAIEILQDIPDDKVAPVIEVLKGLRALYAVQTERSAAQETTPESVMGICHKYANPDLIPLEKGAWGEAVKEKHGVH